MREGLKPFIKDRCGPPAGGPRARSPALPRAPRGTPRTDPPQTNAPLRTPRDPRRPAARKHRLRSYKRCFPGAAAASWLVSAGHAADEDGAVALGNALLQAGLLHHVAYEQAFKSSNTLLYK